MLKRRLIYRHDDAEAGRLVKRQNDVQRLDFHRPKKQAAGVRLVIGILGDCFTLSDHGQHVIATDPAFEHTLNRVAPEDHPRAVHESSLWYQQPRSHRQT